MSKYFSIKLHREVFARRTHSKASQTVEQGLGFTCGNSQELDANASGVSADASASELGVYQSRPSIFLDPPLDLVPLDMPALLARTAKFAPLNTVDLSDSDDGSIQNSPVVGDSDAFMTGPLTGSMPPESSSWQEDLESSRVSSVPSSFNTNKLTEESPVSSTEALQATASLQFSGPAKPYSTFMRRSIQEEDDFDTEAYHKSVRSASQRSALPKLRALDGEDDDILPFERTKQMASRGVRRGSADVLPTISPSITMTMDRYQNYRKSLSSLEMLHREDSLAKSPGRKKTGGDHETDEESDGEADGLIASDEKERKREQARRRQQQDAQLSVYRQQMTKVIGNGRPGIPTSASSATLDNTTTFDTLEDDEDDLDDVPLAALRSLTMPQRRGMPRARSSMSIGSELALGDTNNALSPSSSSMLGGIRGGHARQKSGDELPPLPRVFNTEEKRVSRGLVAAISKEEDAKARRKSMPALAPGGVGSVESDMAIADIQMQLQQLAEMQFQLFNQINGNSGPHPPLPQGMASQRASTIFGSGMPPHSARPASIRSFNGAPTAYPFGQRQSLDLGRAPYSPQSFSSNERLESMGVMPQTPPSGQQSPQPEPRALNRPSMMRIVTSPDDDDDDDDDEAWQKMLQERRALRAEWARSST
ncbi:hypothetical protein B9G98_00496 [Wickerhamiella sorbophila]|uniref:Uncharacterized protein n=1 Tax=Wickerhamiella sorbophila TaxID=45607 RepID=A0A2T0FD00_9ASCO|nr:hypothetical protein B9G98_00496 [Wickerhamiella sorbophila]PRT52876.1 hypothetical protein B9G98_00496 [Wickerhamiella sorbophila]